MRDLLVHNGARPHDGHVTLKNVDELRELIKRCLAQEAANAGHTGVVVHLALGLPLAQLLGREVLLDVVSVRDHGAELEQLKVLAAKAQALL